jgi:2-amino-4-hydroxy-6-hydroxymethyldihydropteridine diphosphokinase
MHNISNGPALRTEEVRINNPKHTIYLALGSNLGQRQANLTAALGQLRVFISLQKISALYETEPVGYHDQPAFLNIACSGYTSLSPQELLAHLKMIEQQLGRQTTFRNGPRTIDIDILLYDDLVLTQENLVIPHPRMRERAFVLVPLAEIAATLHDPVNGHTIEDLQQAIGHQGVTQLASNWVPFSYQPE